MMERKADRGRRGQKKKVKKKLKVMENGQEVNRIRRGQRITDDGLWDIKTSLSNIMKKEKLK